jgi:hypothetical protein
MSVKLIFPFCLLLSAPLVAQKLEHFDLIQMSANQSADSSWHVGNPRFLSKFNPNGYNNQPAFFSADELYLTVQMPNDTTQTDIVSLNLATKQRTQVTATPKTAEYSAQPMPGGRRFSSVRVEEDGTQRLWSFPLDRSDNGRPEFPKISGVGYHCWLRDTLAALFIVGENSQPHTLYACGTKGQKLVRIAANVGRGLQALPNGKLAYVIKATEQTWFLKTWDPRKQSSEQVIKMPLGVEDFALLPDGAYIAGSKSKLYIYKPGRTPDWLEISDLSRYGVRNITRLAVYKDGKLVLTVQ